jgi:predicted glycogen debranching enzyme
MNTRKYHGLLIASKKPPLDRKVVFSKIEDEIIIDDQNYQLSTNRYSDVVFPRGFELMENFEFQGNPKFSYSVSGVKIDKEIFMIRGKNIVVVTYQIDSGGKDVVLRLRPLINDRSIYETREQRRMFEQETTENSTKINFSQDEFLKMSVNQGKYFQSTLEEEQKWYKNFYYEIEAQRGEANSDNCYNPGFFEIKGNGKFQFFLVASYCDEKEYDYLDLNKKEVERKEKLLDDFFKMNKVNEQDWIKWLILSADNHLIKRFDGKPSIIAGYHWFGEWSRDTMISLPGICLKTGRTDEAKQILKAYSKYLKDGLLPNTFPIREGEEPSYNSVDSSLWFVNCVYLYYQETKDMDFVKKLWPVILEIIEKYVEGTNGIRLDKDFLITHGPGMTWMDAKPNGGYATPRDGKSVEIEALWYNALSIAEFFAKKLKENYQRFQFHDNFAKDIFNKEFWKGEHLKDTISDDTVRPNQLIPLDLPFNILPEKKNKKVFAYLKDNLWINYGLRTLLKTSKDFHGIYQGNMTERDKAYHQGTIWLWLNGMFFKVWKKFSDEEIVDSWIRIFVEREINTFGLGTVSEIVDGDEPFESKGCISQAWSIGKFLESISS